MTDSHEQQTTYATHDRPLDGNVLAGSLGDALGVDVTVAVVQCAGCGRRQAVAELVVYSSAMGSVARCRGCGDVVLRVAEVRADVLLDLRGCSVVRLSR
jgi:ribosomal protein S27E